MIAILSTVIASDPREAESIHRRRTPALDVGCTVRGRGGSDVTVPAAVNPNDGCHVLAIYDGSAAARRTLAEAATLTAEHGAALTVVMLVVHERQAVGCCVPAATWNRELDAIVDEQLTQARAILGSYGGWSARFAAVEGAGARSVHQTAEVLGGGLVLVPARGLFPGRLARGCRRSGCARVIAVA